MINTTGLYILAVVCGIGSLIELMKKDRKRREKEDETRKEKESEN